MVAVFAIFATLGMIDFKMMGVGLAVVVLLDATIVRAVLLPAMMKLLGDANWHSPARSNGSRVSARESHHACRRNQSPGASRMCPSAPEVTGGDVGESHPSCP